MINSANGESTNGGSKKVKAICGGFSINEKENSIEMPPEGSKEALLLEGEENFFNIALENDREEVRE